MADRVGLNVGDPLPKSLGQCADAFKDINDLRLSMDKSVKRIKDRENEIKNHILDNLAASDDTGVSGLRYKATVVVTEAPTAEDWEAIYDFVSAEDRFDILGKSLNAKAVKEMWEAGEKMPGVGVVHVKKLSITKR